MPTFYGAIDLVKNELRNAVVQNLGTAPASPLKGQLWMDSSANILKWFDGTVWVNAMSGGAQAMDWAMRGGISTDWNNATTPGAYTNFAEGQAPGPNPNRPPWNSGTDSSAGISAGVLAVDKGDSSSGEIVQTWTYTTGQGRSFVRVNSSFGAWTAWQQVGGTPIAPSDTVTTQAAGDAADGGSGAAYSRGDHRHGMPAFGAVTAQTAFGGTSGNGTGTAFARNDHTHGTPTHDTAAHSGILGNVTAETTFGSASANGTAGTVSRSDHAHGNPTHDAAAHSSLLGNVTAQTAFGAVSGNGTATTISRSDHVHGTPTHDAAAHSAIPLSALAVPTAALALNSQRITGLADPTAAQDGATKIYVDNVAAGLSAKPAVRVATTANITLSGTQTIDGIAVVANDRVLVKNQTTAGQNGIYVAATGAWTRAADLNTWAQVPNAYVWVMVGTSQADTGWVSTADPGGTIGTTAMTWVQFSGTGTWQAGNGLTLTGNSFAVGQGTGITVSASAVAVDTATIATRAYADGLVVGMARKFAAALTGTAAYATGEVVTHNLNTRDVQVRVVNGNSPYQAVEVDWEATSVNTVTLRFNPALGAGFRCVVTG